VVLDGTMSYVLLDKSEERFTTQTMAMEKIAFPQVNLSAVLNPVPTIMSSSEFPQTENYFESSPAFARSLVSSASQALMFSIIRNARPKHIVEIGTFKGGTTECFSRALDANGDGIVHTIGPFDSAHFLPILKNWPDNLRSRVRFYPTDSMNFFMEVQREGYRPWLVFVDGCHDYEFALFDILCAARSISPGGFIVVDNASQAGPYFGAIDFLKANPGWLNCEWKPGSLDPTKAYDGERRAIIGTDFIVLRAPPNYMLGERPQSFGEIDCPAARVDGAKLNLAAPNHGTLHLQCVLRGFSSTQNVERVGSVSQVIEGISGETTLRFEKALALEGEWPACRVELWLTWLGPTPLALNSHPQVI
jgi:predicted O-methyltransferase YrrM